MTARTTRNRPPPMSIREQWRSYMRGVIPAQAGRAQLTETRRAFYAGAHALLGEVCKCSALTDAQAGQHMDDIRRELEAFVARVIDGTEPDLDRRDDLNS